MEEILISTLRLATPLTFAAMGGLLAERAGVIRLGLEGFMLLGALAAAAVTYFTGSPMLGLAAAAGAGLLFSLIDSFLVLGFKADQVITGTALNLLAAGLCPFLTKLLFDSTGSTPSIPIEQRFGFQFTWLAVAIVILVSTLIRFTRFGLWLQFAGDSPQALEAAGVSSTRIRFICVSLSGILAAVGGASLSTSLASSYSPGMTAGRGYIALAAIVFGGWRAWPAFAACLFFALTEAIQIQLQGASPWIPVSFLQILPYLVTIIALVGFFGQNRSPKGLGKV